MSVCHCAIGELESEYPKAGSSRAESQREEEPRVNYQLFNWITILLLTGWMLVVGAAAKTAQMDKPAEAQTTRAFIEGLL